MIDSLIEKSHAAREQLLQQYGGVAGLFDKLEEMDRERLAARTAGKTKKPTMSLTKKRPATQTSKRLKATKSN